MAWSQGKSLHTTRTGRAVPTGKVTRRSLGVRKTKYVKGQDRPLGFDHACHPQALVRTAQHPECRKALPGFDVSRYSELDSLDFLSGVGLVRTRRMLGDDWLRVRFGKKSLGFASRHAALSYRRAAANVGVTLECYDV